MTTRIYGATKPSLEDALEHHGVKGQRWGVRRRSSTGMTNHQLNKASRARDKARQKANNEAFKKSYNAEIDAARNRVNSGKTDTAFKNAKSRAKAQKREVGSRETRKAIAAAREKRNTDYSTAGLTKYGAERTGAILGAVGGAVAVGALNVAVARRGL